MTQLQESFNASEVEQAVILTGMISELDEWSLELAAYPVDGIPQLVATIDCWGLHRVTAIEIAQVREATGQGQIGVHRRRFALHTPHTAESIAEHQTADDPEPIVCAMPLTRVHTGRRIAYEVLVLRDNERIGRVAGAFYIAHGRLVPC